MTGRRGATPRRRCGLPALLRIQRSGTLTLLNPEKWEDRNDAYYIGGPLLHGCSSRWPLAPAEPFEISLHLTYTDESKSEAGKMQRGFANHFSYFDLGSNSGGPFLFP